MGSNAECLASLELRAKRAVRKSGFAAVVMRSICGSGCDNFIGIRAPVLIDFRE